MLSEEDLNELLRLERAMWSKTTRYDVAFQEKHFAEDFFEFGRSGRVYSRSEIIATTGPEIEVQLLRLQVRALSSDQAQVTYDSIVTGPQGAKEYARRSSVWSRAGSSWVMRFHQGTPFVPSA